MNRQTALRLSPQSLACLASLALTSVVAACGSVRLDPPPVQESSPAAATALVRVSAGQPFAASCLLVDVGATVEWRNLSPRSAISVVSAGGSRELSSPVLRAPYNYVPADASDECALKQNDICVEPLPHSYWRHTFKTPGIFDYRDANDGSGTSTLYAYGMPVGTTTASASGTVCVRSAPGDIPIVNCQQVCCTGAGAGECAPGVTCISGRCGGVSQAAR